MRKRDLMCLQLCETASIVVMSTRRYGYFMLQYYSLPKGFEHVLTCIDSGQVRKLKNSDGLTRRFGIE